MRLDLALVERGLAPTRSRARDLIRSGLVRVGEVVCTKAAAEIRPETKLVLDDADAARAVSRGGQKLSAGLDAFGFDPAGRVALDVGASTGGFTQVLLERGASKVYAADVGHGQLHASLLADSRVVSLEGVDARKLTRELVPQPVGAIVTDLSFISLSKALGAPLQLAEPGAFLVALVKPQFEVGPDRIGKGGIVRDEAARLDALRSVVAWVAAQPGWRVVGEEVSPITGGSGNIEFLIGALNDG
ncbi:TlyA family rRNA (cytidine-2'-O)-methyltransferase [Hyphomicrobium sulfonivorans]|nr:TlyA family RNA methyltransferase [Hyphomicrobium sulfonivorans]NSL71690.1 TlyA family rRNA (cytidine-2'-O)-methyltransferase [Hyphomicrobium sulfonivorans]